MMTQTLALLLDAYRELQAKKMFWIVLGLNILVMCLFGIIGANDHTITVLWFEPLGKMAGINPLYLYKSIFSNLIMGFWFTWVAALLAVISTAGIFPDFLSSGSIDLYLAKPIGRMRLFLTKYAAGLLFVVLQVSVFSLLSFFILGFRAGIWEIGLFAAIPIVVLFFSYLFAFSALFGVWTRSTIATLMLTLLAWLCIWAVDRGERLVYQIAESGKTQLALVDDQVEALDVRINELEKTVATQTAPASEPSSDASELDRLRDERKQLLDRRQDVPVTPTMLTAERVAFGLKSLVPKTRETINLLDRVIFTDKDLQAAAQPDEDAPTSQAFRPRRPGRRFQALMLEQAKVERQRPVWWVIGTSLLFEAIVLALAVWHFCTRDF